MARVDNTKTNLAGMAISYITDELNTAREDFIEEENRDSKFSTTHVSGRDSSAKTHADNAVKMLRWLYEIEFALTPPTPLTDAEVDAIDVNIRTFDDGT